MVLGCGCFGFACDKTAVSVSGSEYGTDEHMIEPNDIITTDLNPQSNCVWGDYAGILIVKDTEEIRVALARKIYGLSGENML